MNPLMWNPWLVLLLAGLFEIGWPLGLKLGTINVAMRYVGPAIAVACMATSGFFLWLSLKHIPMGTAYAVWTGIGSLGAFLVGVYVFGDTASLIRWAGIALVVSGIVCLKMG